MTETEELIYPSSLLKIESGQQFKKGRVSLLDAEAKFTKVLNDTVNKKIHDVIQLNEKENGASYSIELPEELKRAVSSDTKKKVVKELTAYEVRTLTAIVKLSEIARLAGDLHRVEKLRRNNFEKNIDQKILGKAL